MSKNIVDETALHFVGVNNCNLYLVNSYENWDRLVAWLMEQPIFAADTETDGFHYYLNNRIAGMSFGWGTEHFYVPVRHKDSFTGGVQLPQLDIDKIRPDLKRIFGRPNVTVVGHNFKFDQHFYRSDGIEVLCKIEDTCIKWALYDENAPAALKTICSGWKDILGRWHPGIVHKSAAADEKILSEWRANEAKARRKEYNKLVTDRSKEVRHEIRYQGMKLVQIKDNLKKTEFAGHPFEESTKDDVDYAFIPIDMMTQYAALDTFLTYSVYNYLEESERFLEGSPLKALYDNEIELSAALLDMEENGMLCSREYLKQKSIEFEQKIKEKSDSLKAIIGDVNLNAPQQVAQALVNLGVPIVIKQNDSGKEAYASDKKELKKLANKYPIVKEILLYRQIIKLKNTYFDSILDKLTPTDYCHTSFNQNVSTGRMSSSRPNFQNMPRGKLVRGAFMCPKDYIYILADYSQIEIRITAHYSGDPLLLDAYKTGKDVHTLTLSEVFGIPYDLAVEAIGDKDHPRHDEIDTLRTICKIVNFGIIYGVSPAGLAEQIPQRPAKYANYSHEEWVEVCVGYVDAYLAKYKGVKRFVDKYSFLVKKQGYVDNHFGRRRHLPHVHATSILGDRSKFWLERKAQRQGVNYVIQGSASDLFKIAIARINKLLKASNAKTRLVNNVHDEVQFYLHKDEIHLLPKIKHAMEDFNFAVPIIAEFSYSNESWADKQALKG